MAAVSIELTKDQIKRDAGAAGTSPSVVATKMKIYIGASVAQGEKTTLMAGCRKLLNVLKEQLKKGTSGDLVVSFEAPLNANKDITLATVTTGLTANSVALVYSGTFNGTKYTATGLANTTGRYLIDLLNDELGAQ
jgi:hypothetical protein